MSSIIDLNEYQEFTVTTAVFPREQQDSQTVSAMYLALGLNGEAGEVAEVIKKLHRDAEYPRDVLRDKLKKELGDVFWYLTMIANTYGITLEDILHANMVKLSSRQQRGVLGGSGDER